MASFLVLVGLFAVGISTASAATCDACFSTFTTDTAAATGDAAKCTVADTYLTCLLSATGAGCGTLAAKVAALVTARAALNLATAGSCPVLSGPCTCETTWRAAEYLTGTNTNSQCVAAAAYVGCTFVLNTDTTASCISTVKNSDLKYRARVAFSQYCTCSGHSIRFSIATLLFVVVGMFFKN